MAFYHVAFTACMTIQGGPHDCQPEKMVDTKFMGLVNCYSAAKQVEAMAADSANKSASEQNVTLSDVKITTRCLTLKEGEEFLIKNGPSALIVTGKEFN